MLGREEREGGRREREREGRGSERRTLNKVRQSVIILGNQHSYAIALPESDSPWYHRNPVTCRRYLGGWVEGWGEGERIYR